MADSFNEPKPGEFPVQPPAAPRTPPPRPSNGPRPMRRPVVANRREQAPERSSNLGALLVVCVLAIAAAGTATYLIRQRMLRQAAIATAEQEKKAAEQAGAPQADLDFGIPDPRQLYFGGREGSWWVSRLRDLRQKRLDQLYQLTVKRAEASGLRVVDGPDGPDISAGPQLVAALQRGTSAP